MLPNFMVVGAQKAGTTSLHHYLKSHPEIYLPERKETKFFVFDERYEKGIDSYQEEYFSPVSSEKAIGEIDPDYMYFPCALDRMKEHLDMGSLKIIFLLRNPVERAFSHYQMTYRRGLEPLSFEEALEQEAERMLKDQISDMHYSYAERGYYYKQISRFLEHVDREQVLILLSEDLKDKPEETIGKVCKFLDVSSDFTPENTGEQYHKATKPKSMSLLHRIKQHDGIEKKILRILIPWTGFRHKLRQKILDLNQVQAHKSSISTATKSKLIECYREDIGSLAGLLNRDLSHWLT